MPFKYETGLLCIFINCLTLSTIKYKVLSFFLKVHILTFKITLSIRRLLNPRFFFKTTLIGNLQSRTGQKCPHFLCLFPYCLRLFEEKVFIFGISIITATLKPEHHNFITLCGRGLWNKKEALAHSMITSLLQLIPRSLDISCNKEMIIGEQPSLFTGHSYMYFLRAKCQCIRGCLLRYACL